MPKQPSRAPTGPEMAAALRRVNPATPTALILRDDVLREVQPIYEELARECQRAEHRKLPTRPAFRRWRSRIAPLLKRLEAETAVPEGPFELRVMDDPFAAMTAN